MNRTQINIAIVDDNESFARSLERLFRASGFSARTYHSAEAFLDSAPFPKPDCLVLDVQLGGMSGLELQQRLHEVGDSTPIIFVTAHDAPKVCESARKAGCSAYFLKPVPRNSLIEAINKAVNPDSQ